MSLVFTHYFRVSGIVDRLTPCIDLVQFIRSCMEDKLFGFCAQSQGSNMPLHSTDNAILAQ